MSTELRQGAEKVEATTAQEQPQCRICQEVEADAAESCPWAEELLEPCLCDGSVGRMHRRCLDRWRLEGLGGRGHASQRCELCGFAFVQERRRAKRFTSVVKVLIEVFLLSLPLLVIYALIGVATLPVIGMVSVFGLLGAWAVVDVSMSATGSSSGIFGQAVRQLCSPILTKEEAELANSELGVRLSRLAVSAAPAAGRDGSGIVQAWLKTLPSQKRLVFLLPLVLPHLLTAGLFLLRWLIGHKGLERLGLWLAALGGSYSVLVVFTRMLAAMLRPPWILERDERSLSVVRSLTPYEKELGRKKSN